MKFWESFEENEVEIFKKVLKQENILFNFDKNLTIFSRYFYDAFKKKLKSFEKISACSSRFWGNFEEKSEAKFWKRFNKILTRFGKFCK